MAESSVQPIPEYDRSYVRQIKDLANGQHSLAKYIPPLLLLADAALCSLVIWKISCKALPFSILLLLQPFLIRNRK